MRHSAALAIGIVAYNRAHLTRRCLDSVRRHAAVGCHIYLVDNGSWEAASQQLLAECENHSDITLIRLDCNVGPSGGRNAILDRALGRHTALAMLDNDIAVLPGWDVAALRALESDCDMVQPKLLSVDEATVDRGPCEAYPERYLLYPRYLGRGFPREAAEVSRRVPVPLCGGTAVLAASVFERVGRYDESLWMAEDFDLAIRGAAVGIRIGYEPECEMVHDHPWDGPYDTERFSAQRSLESHLVLWRKHRKLFQPPHRLYLWRHLLKRGLPLDLPPRKGRIAPDLPGRIWRRVLRSYYLRRCGEYWMSEAWGAAVTEELQCLWSERTGRIAPNESAA